jgi:hypothetical protein
MCIMHGPLLWHSNCHRQSGGSMERIKYGSHNIFGIQINTLPTPSHSPFFSAPLRHTYNPSSNLPFSRTPFYFLSYTKSLSSSQFQEYTVMGHPKFSDTPVYTASNGAPIFNPNASQRVGTSGPLLLQDFHLIDLLAHFDRERIPERYFPPPCSIVVLPSLVSFMQRVQALTEYLKSRMISPI